MLYLTRHAEVRLRQRGLREDDVGVVLRHGTATQEAVVLTRKDVARAVAEHRREISRLERLCGTAVFTRDAAVLTVFRPTPDQLRRLLAGDPGLRRVRRTRRRCRSWPGA